MRCLGSITDSMDMNLSKLQEMVKTRGSRCAKVHEVTKSWIQFDSQSESEVAQSYPTLHDPMEAAYQAPPSMGFSRQEYWSGVPLPSLKKGHKGD